jgi:hypothetical protein
MLFLGTLGGILGSVIYNVAIAGGYALYLYKIQQSELADRMWLKEAPKQEFTDSNHTNYKRKNYYE